MDAATRFDVCLTMDVASFQVCGKCSKNLPLACFSLRKRGSSSRHSQCKACCSEIQRQWRKANRLHKNEKWLAWVRDNKEKFSATQSRYKSRNLEKLRASYARYFAENKEKILEKSRLYYSENAELHATRVRRAKAKNILGSRAIGANYRARKRMAKGSHTAADIKSLFQKQKGKCIYCGIRLKDAYHVDHIEPLSKGGTNSKENLQILCASCNSKKSNLDPFLFARRIGRLV